jgi:hypothetical protein
MRNGKLCPGERDKPLEKSESTERECSSWPESSLTEIEFCLMELVHIHKVFTKFLQMFRKTPGINKYDVKTEVTD